MDYQALRSLPEMFFLQSRSLADKPFLWRKQDGVYRPLTYGEAGYQAGLLARGLIDLGVGPGDRVALVAENRPEWLIADHAIMAAGAITVPAFTTNTPADHLHVLTNSGAKGAIISGKALARRFLPAALESPDLRFIISMEALDLAQEPPVRVFGWAQLLAQGAKRPESEVQERVARLGRGDPCCFIYTSGTGGVPRGVVLTHGSILCNLMGCHHLLRDFGLGEEVFLSFLPLSHSYEHTAGQFLPISLGAQIYYAEHVDKLIDDLAAARPTLMLAVPRLYEVMHQRIMRSVERTKGLRRWLFDRALALGRKRYEQPRGLSVPERLLDRLVERLVRDKVRQRFGGRLRAMISGGAALNLEIGLFFTALGVRLLQGYGQTETSPIVSVNPPHKVKLHTVGPPLQGIEVRIAEDGEILVRGEAVMQGYWRDAEGTAAAVRDGWLHTGDIGVIDGDGYLQITDRKKDIIVFSGGDNVSPARVEGFLCLEPEIAQAMVHGDRRAHLVALLVPDTDFVRGWAQRAGRPNELAALVDDPDLHEALAAAVARVNAKLSQIERIRRFCVAGEPFTTDNAMMTPSLKIRRHKIRERYGTALDRLYDRAGSEGLPPPDAIRAMDPMPSGEQGAGRR
ncbi:MAG TPA: long-chain fatty acid--CoA ligase [Candidatus Acidoferrum sp.]|nr:long-chain fatty acid--CoA ligase [Candidatus Acidoferrum sp.]